MSAKKQEKQELLGIRNDDARIYTFSYAVEKDEHSSVPGVIVREKRVEQIKIMPGMNFVDKSEFNKCVLQSDLDDGRVAGYDALSVVDVAGLPVGQAKALIANTSNRKHLRAWLESETRQPVREALEERLA